MDELVADASRIARLLEAAAGQTTRPEARSALRVAEALALALCDEIERAACAAAQPSGVPRCRT